MQEAKNQEKNEGITTTTGFDMPSIGGVPYGFVTPINLLEESSNVNIPLDAAYFH